MKVRLLIQTYKKLFYCIVLFIVICIFCKYFRSYVSLIIIIFILYCVSNFINKFLIKIGVKNYKICSLISIIFINLSLALFIFKISNYVIMNIGNIYDGFMYIMDIYNGLCIRLLGKMNLHSITRNIISGVQTGFNYKNIITQGAIGTTDFLISYGLGNIIVYFLIMDKESIRNALLKLFSVDIFNNIKERFISIKKILLIQVRIMAISTLITILGFYIFRIKYAFSIGIICGILDILPVIGTIFVFLPLVLYEIFLNKYISALGLIVLYFFIAILRKILETKFLGESFQVHPVVILICMYMFVKNIGVIGAIVAPLYVIMAKEILQL